MHGAFFKAAMGALALGLGVKRQIVCESDIVRYWGTKAKHGAVGAWCVGELVLGPGACRAP